VNATSPRAWLQHIGARNALVHAAGESPLPMPTSLQHTILPVCGGEGIIDHCQRFALGVVIALSVHLLIWS